MSLPLMPKATAVWLIDKTALTFDQIAEFCGMHPLEIQAIADGEVAQGINGYDPVANKQITAEDITRCEADPQARLRLLPPADPLSRKTKGGRYTPVAKRNDRPDAIAFLLRKLPAFDRCADHQAAGHHQGHHPENQKPVRIGTVQISNRAIRLFWGCASNPT